MEEPTNRELNIMLKAFKESVDEKFKDIFMVLSEIRETGKDTNTKAGITNGKIADAHLKIARLQSENKYMKWLIGVVIGAVVVAVPIFRTIVTSDIKNIVVEVLNENVEEVTR